MSEEILMNITPMETRVAVVENGVLQEVHIERTQSRGLVGNIYKGRVVRVLPGMQAAFVDIGLERAAFIHIGELQVPEGRQIDSISGLLHDGQALVVQVTKDPIGSKGARLTTYFSMPSRYLVHMPSSGHIGVSLKIEDESERDRLKELVGRCLAAEGLQHFGGFIIRTAAEGVTEDDMKADILYLYRLWQQVQEQIRGGNGLIYEELPLALRTLRDLVGEQTEKIRIDSRETLGRAQQFVSELVPGVDALIEHYPGERPLFDLHGIEDEIQRALERKVPLKSGGYLIIDPTEAMTTIDVNTGAFVGHRNLEETIFKTNLEAAMAIARQLRLRNVGGIIIIDFIDMEDEEHRRQVLRTLERQLERDHAKTHITGLTELGLVQMTRKRTRESLSQLLCEPCATCQGRGELRTAETVCYEVFREILREARAYQAEGYLVLASQNVVDRLLDEESANLADLETFIGRPIKLQVESLYSQEQYDIVLL
ncbi:MAG: ribonuclease G [Thiopseudomonas sp.]|nr:ribonuclease G [Thiopseudomonas sp.]